MDKIIKDDLINKLKYLGLDLDNIPECLKEYEPLNFNITRLNNDKDHRVFKYIPIDQIQILFTPSLRSDTIKEKYSNSLPLSEYIEPNGDTEENIERYSTFLKMISTVSIPDIENISNIQNELEKKEPFKVKYNKDSLWQIYYSESTNKYFICICNSNGKRYNCMGSFW